MDLAGLSWLTPLQGSLPRNKRVGRPRKVNPVVETWIHELRQTHSIIEISRITKLNRDTVAFYLGRQKRG